MTYQFLTVEMMKSALNKDGVIDQTRFKTEATYGFNSLLFSKFSLEKAKEYIDFIRPKLNPTCEYLLINKNGRQLSNLGDVFGKMVYQAIGKYVNPTRYRQIIGNVPPTSFYISKNNYNDYKILFRRETFISLNIPFSSST